VWNPNTGVTGTGGQALLHYTFNTPVGVPDAQQCGKVLFSDFHVANASTSPSTAFPTECMTNETTGKACTTAAPCPMTPQEKVLEYMLWDLASCVPPPPKPVCTPLTCAGQSIQCGPAGDGCGNVLDCGTCTPPQTCGGGGVPGQCGTPPEGGVVCQPVSCQQQGIGCGPAGDGCGNALNCGTCTPPQTCGGGGVPGQCGGQCVPLTCAQQNIHCGPAGDGCGNLLDCGACVAPQTCGGGGVPGQCGGGVTCVPKTCSQLNIQCGPAGDGCGGLLDCGQCVSPQTCGGGGVPGQCGGGTR